MIKPRKSKYGPLIKGTVRDDGKIFLGYTKYRSGNIGEMWISQERYNNQLEKVRARTKAFIASGGKFNKKKLSPEDKAYLAKQHRDRYAKRPEHYRAMAAKWRAKRTEAISIYSKKFRDNNPEKMKEFRKAWVERNEHKKLYYGIGRRCATQTAFVVTTKEMEDFYKFCTILNAGHKHYRKKAMFNVDHIIPLSKGGLHEETNLQLTTSSYNNKKASHLNYPRGQTITIG